MSNTSKSRLGRPAVIFHLVSSLNVGGTQTGMLQTIPQLDPAEFTSVVCSIMPPGRISAELEAKGIPNYSLGVTSPLDLRAFPRLLRLLRSERPDILHSYLFHANLMGRIGGKIVRVPVVNSERTINQHGSFQARLSRITAPLATVVETNSNAGREYVLSNLGITAKKVHVLYPGVSLSDASLAKSGKVRQMLGLDAKVPIAGFFGRLYPVKGAEFSIRAFAKIISQIPEAHLIMVGDGPLRQCLERLAFDEGIGEAVHFLGEREDVREIMPEIDVLVLSSLTESLPRVVLEAMDAGKPVVAHRVGGVPEVVEDGITGLLTTPGDADELAASLIRVLSDRQFGRRLGDAGRARVEQTFSEDASISRYEELYRRILRDP